MPNPEQTFIDDVMAVPQSQVDPDTLEALGRQASAMHLEGGAELNDAVPRAIKGSGRQLNSQQVQRVLEFANQFTHIGYMGKNEDYPEFGLADPSSVHNTLSEGEAPETVSTDSDYDSPPEASEPTPELPAQESGPDEHEKAAGVFALHDLERARHRLTGYADHASSQLDTTINLYKVAVDELNKEAKRYILDGGCLGDLAMVAGSLDGGSFAKQAMADVVDWISERVPPDVVRMSLEKTAAGRVINPDHPLVLKTGSVVKLAKDMHTQKSFLDDMRKEGRRVTDYLKERARATR